MYNSYIISFRYTLYACFRLSYRTLAEDTMMQLSMAHGLTGNVGYLKAQVGDKILQFEP